MNPEQQRQGLAWVATYERGGAELVADRRVDLTPAEAEYLKGLEQS